jgi:hypothetical protein
MPLETNEANEASDAAKENRQRPVSWFSPGQLWRTNSKVTEATSIASHADQREIQAGVATLYLEDGTPAFHDFSKYENFGFDFVADTGDGWDATVAVADLMLRKSLDLGTVTLPRPKVAIFGGDLVYPVASRLEYKRRFIGPFNYAAYRNGEPWYYAEEKEALQDDTKTPRVFAIPGNHDWYDGLTAFWSLFCRARIRPDGKKDAGLFVGPWLAKQQRSYFALKLPDDWWVWGIDVQLSGWPDTPQRRYFDDLAAECMSPFSKLVICTAEPSWVHGQLDGPEHFRGLSYMANRALRRRIQVRAVLSGDLHHYSRYEGSLVSNGESPMANGCTLITAGGGGAYSLGTYALPDTICIRKIEEPYLEAYYASPSAKLEEKTLYPSGMESRLATLTVPFYFIPRNISFAVLAAGLWMVVCIVAIWGAKWSPLDWPTGLIAVAVFGLPMVGFAHLGRARWVSILDWIVPGLLHAFAQAFAGVWVARLLWSWGAHKIFAEWGLLCLAGAVTTCVVMSLNLVLSSNGFDRHHNEVFSALGSTKWKNFLRIVVDDKGMHIHAVGMDTLPAKGQTPEAREIDYCLLKN